MNFLFITFKLSFASFDYAPRKSPTESYAPLVR